MSQREENAYILGTETAELHRLGLQHQVWSAEALEGWKIAGFKPGDTILDLGCGPGFCTRELAYMVGERGKVIGVDMSAGYIDFLEASNKLHQLNIETQLANFDDMILEDNSLDGVYCRWAMAWITNNEEILAKVAKAMKPGARIVLHEYFDWSTFQTVPHMPALMKGVTAILKGFTEPPSNINIGRELPGIFKNIGLKLHSQRGMHKMPKPTEMTWEWPNSFLKIYMPKLIDQGKLSQSEVDAALEELDVLSANPDATIFTPMMVEVIGEKD